MTGDTKERISETALFEAMYNEFKLAEMIFHKLFGQYIAESYKKRYAYRNSKCFAGKSVAFINRHVKTDVT